MKEHATLSSRLNTGLLLTFPFLVLFSPRFNLVFTHARVDEFIVLLSLPFAVIHYAKFAIGNARRGNIIYFRALLILFLVFAIGLLYGEGVERWSQSNLMLVARPIVVILNVLVVRYWIYRAQANSFYLITGLVVAVTLAGVLGCLAMGSPALAGLLQETYASGIDLYGETSRFDMSIRAMSVFSGYDQASMAYALGGGLSLFLFYNARTIFGKLLSVLAMFCLIISIVASARIGFVALLFCVFVILSLSIKIRGKIVKISYICGFILLLSFFLFPLSNKLFPNNITVERFSDVFQIFDIASSQSVEERSEGVSGVLSTEVYQIRYPDGIDMLLGFGDHGVFVSDVGLVTVYVKYGIVGIASLLYAFAAISFRGFRTGRIADTFYTGRGSISAILPGLMALFIVGSMKGGLYFITYKVGELFAFVLALCIIEGEVVLACRFPREGNFSRRFFGESLSLKKLL